MRKAALVAFEIKTDGLSRRIYNGRCCLVRKIGNDIAFVASNKNITIFFTFPKWHLDKTFLIPEWIQSWQKNIYINIDNDDSNTDEFKKNDNVVTASLLLKLKKNLYKAQVALRATLAGKKNTKVHKDSWAPVTRLLF